jgi:zinc/manganese transport system substrate-binding protein
MFIISEMRTLPLILLTALLTLGCGDDGASSAGECPTDPVPVVASIGPWGDVATAVGGDCVQVTTIVGGTGVDPHEYEPTASDLAQLNDAALVVLNGGHYDEWAVEGVETLDKKPVIIEAAELAGRSEDENPHLWYDPQVVRQVGDEITTALTELRPAARNSLKAAGAEWTAALDEFDALVAQTRAETAGVSFAATEPVFEYLADAIGLEDQTPSGWKNAVANETEPGPADVAAFESLLQGGSVSLLIDNPQTAGPITERLRSVATDAGVPVVEISESRSEDHDSFLQWQTAQLQAIASALTQ